MTKAVFRKQGQTLVAECDASIDMLAQIRDGRQVIVEVRTARNPAHLRKFFKMLAMVVDSGAWDGDVESLLDWVKIRVGHVNRIYVNDRCHFGGNSSLWSRCADAPATRCGRAVALASAACAASVASP